MTRTEELLKLAEAAIKERPARNILYKLQDAANPETIKQLVELCRLQHEALKWHTGMTRPIARTDEALAAFNHFERGEA